MYSRVWRLARGVRVVLSGDCLESAGGLFVAGWLLKDEKKREGRGEERGLEGPFLCFSLYGVSLVL